MEGGARQSRASSRNAAAAAAAAAAETPTSPFNGPVRKWKKRWVTVSPSPTISTHRTTTPLVLFRWVPDSDDASTDHSPPRRFRYVPDAPSDKGKQTVAVTEGKLIISNESVNGAEDIPIGENEEPSEEHEPNSEKTEGEGNDPAKKMKVSPSPDGNMLN